MAKRVGGVLLVAASVLHVSCTTRESVSDVRSSISFDQSVWGSGKDGKGGGDDRDEIRKKFAEKGWKVDDDGNIVSTKEKNNNMYRGDEFRTGGKSFDGKKSIFSKKKIKDKDLEMPEYLNRQKEFAAGESKDSSNMAREGFLSKFLLKDNDAKADTRGKSWISKLGGYDTDSARESGKRFKSSEDKRLAKASREAVEPDPKPMAPGGGFYRDSDMSVDDVRKLVSPEGVLR